MSKMTRWFVGVCLIAGALAVCVPLASHRFNRHPSTASAQGAEPAVQTASVVRTTLTSRSVLTGVLGYEGSYSAAALSGGVLTQTPDVGTTVSRGQLLFSVNDRPTVLLYGQVPAWRPYGSTTSRGADIAQLAANLVAMDYLSAADATDRPTPAITAAVKLLQQHLSVPTTGRLRLGDVVFLPGPARVTSLSQAVGTQVAAGTALISATSDRVGAQVQLDPATAATVRTGDEVLITTPDGVRRTARIREVSTVADSTPGDGGPPTVTVPADVQFSPAWQPGARAIDQAPVQISITVRAIPDALAVPVTSLVGQTGGGYAVETVSPTGHDLVAVTPGLFDELSGLVEVTSGGLRAGQRIVVAAS